jgi:IrrE N-terminal-like domain
MTAPRGAAQALIERLVQNSGERDAESAIRARAAQVIDEFVMIFGEPEQMPLDLLALASFLGIKLGDDAPSFSPDAELAPDGRGGVEMRLNPDRPETRQRFSIGHEITHTFFPEYSSHVWPRADARYRDLNDPNDYLEMLCDIGAAELVFPRRWFSRHAANVTTAAGLVELAQTYRASRQATVRRFAELNTGEVAAVFLSWKLKPTQRNEVGRVEQPNLFGTSPEEEVRQVLRLRVEYSIPSPTFREAGHFVPRDKSVQPATPLHDAAVTASHTQGECHLDLGQSSGLYRIHAVPLWTPEEDRGPNGEVAVAAILRPVKVRRPKKKCDTTETPSFF